MNADSIRKLFEQVRRGKLSPDEAVERLRHLPFEDLGFAKVDHHRALRNGMPEVIFGQGKTPAQMASIFSRLAKQGGIIAVVSAGTSDIPVAEEAVVTAEMMGNDVEHLYDVGIAGIHRLLANRASLTRARVVIVCAGMEGALPSVVGGLVGVPVIAVPTSVGYGAAFKGLAALLGMMNSCASNVSVVNIDNGFGAGYVAALINRL